MDNYINSENRPAWDPEEIGRILADLMKTIKVVSVYPENNPIPTRLKESFIERFTDLIKEHKKIVFVINQEEIHFEGEAVYTDDSSDDTLASIFHNAGITEISFAEDFDYKEAEEFFRALKSFVNKEPGAEDLVALFWQANIDGFDYATIEDVALKEYEGEFLVQESCVDEGSFIRRSADDDSGKVQYAEIFLDDDDAGVEDAGDSSDAGNYSSIAGLPIAGSVPAGFMPSGKKSSEDAAGISTGGTPITDTTLILNDAFTLEEEELKKVESLVKEDASFDLFTDTIELLQEMLHQEKEFQNFSEVIILTEKLQTEFIKLGNLKGAGEIIDRLKETGETIKSNDPRFKERVHNALVMSGGWEKLSHLAEVLNADSSTDAGELIAYLNHFGWESLSTVTDLLGVLEYRAHREAICDYLADKGRDHIDIISKGIFDRRWFVVRNTAAILTQIGTEEAIPYLEKAITHEDFRVRYQVALGVCREVTEENIELLFKLIWDNDERVRSTAIEAILDQKGEIVLKTIVRIINDDRFASLSELIQERMIMTLSELGGEHAVNYLTSLVSDGGMFQSQVKDFYQRLAFKALAHNMSEKAEKVLLKYSRSWRRHLRRLAGMALKERREFKYSGES